MLYYRLRILFKHHNRQRQRNGLEIKLQNSKVVAVGGIADISMSKLTQYSPKMTR
jgi:hypothetical protein